MKKIYIAMAVIGTVALVSCEREKSFNELTPIGENGVAFTIGGVSTRSAEPGTTVVPGVSIPMGTDDQGHALFLEETIEELNPTPATKGAPAYTVNVGDIYDNMGVFAVGGNFGNGEVSYEVMDMYDHKGDPSDPKAPKTAGPENDKGDGWRYHHNYASSPWPESENEKVDFYFNMPAAHPKVSFTSRADKKIKFTYDMSAITKAEDQEDLLFSQASYSKSDHDGYLPNGAPVLMYHALTGVKFRSGSTNNGATKTIITKVEFQKLKNSGTCDINLAATGDKVVWSSQSIKNGSNGYFYQDFKNQDWTSEGGVDGTVDYGTYVEGTSKFGESWYKAAGDKNLNNAEGTQTFWFIPQTISEDVILKVTFRVKTEDTQDGTEITHTIKFGKLVNNVEWKAGQLRTYTLNPLDVDVEIFDTMEGLEKSGLHVTNTGNVNEYVRMLVIGNWYGWLSEESQTKGDEPSILVGYKTETGSEMVNAWYNGDDTYGTGFDPSFQKGKPLADSKWKEGTGGYYYYTEPIGVGDKLSGTDALFDYYKLNEEWIPTIWIPSSEGGRVEAVGVHLIMECAIQAISTLDPNGDEYQTCWAAWTAATGKQIAQKQ